MQCGSLEIASINNNMIILIGSAASGKSTFTVDYLQDCDIINQDTLLTIAKCKKRCIEYINTHYNTHHNTHHNIVIDNCNRDIKTRKVWIDIANTYNYNIIMINFYMLKECALHINKFRSLTSNKQIPNIAIHSFYKNFKEPNFEECNYIFNIPFLPNSENEHYNSLLCSFLI